jgi:hypothetical protein
VGVRRIVSDLRRWMRLVLRPYCARYDLEVPTMYSSKGSYRPLIALRPTVFSQNAAYELVGKSSVPNSS